MDFNDPEHLIFHAFTLWQLRTIQQGIQPGHAIVEMFVKYQDPYFSREIASQPHVMLYEFARNHKTFLLRNGGDAVALERTYHLIKSAAEELNLPWASFNEDASLYCNLTSVGVIVPQKIAGALTYKKALHVDENLAGQKNRGARDYYYHVCSDAEMVMADQQPLKVKRAFHVDSASGVLATLIQSSPLAT